MEQRKTNLLLGGVMVQEERIKERVSDAIIDLIHRNDLSNVKLSKILGCNRNTVNNHRLMAHLPRLKFITKLTTIFNVDLNWIYFGVGEMYLDDEPDPPGPNHARGYDSDPHASLDDGEMAESVATPPPISEKADGAAKDPRVEDVLEKAAEVLRSQTTYGKCLLDNIEYLAYIIEAEERREKIVRGIEQLLREVASLLEKVETLAIRSSKPKRQKKKNPVKKPKKRR